MPLNGSGVYTLPSPAYPARGGETALADDVNEIWEDIEEALRNAVFKDGQQIITANIPMGGFTFTDLAQAAANGEPVIYQQLKGSAAGNGPGFIPYNGATTYSSGSVGAVLNNVTKSFYFDASADQRHVGFGVAAVPESMFVFATNSDRDGTGIVHAYQVQRVWDVTQTAWTGVRANQRIATVLGNVDEDAMTFGAPVGLLSEMQVYKGATVSGAVRCIYGTIANEEPDNPITGLELNLVDSAIYSVATDVPKFEGVSIDAVAVGLDHPTARSSAGNRTVIRVLAQTNGSLAAEPDYAEAEFGTGFLLEHETSTTGSRRRAYFRNGIWIRDNSGSSGLAMTNAGIKMDVNGLFGLDLSASPTTAVINISDVASGPSYTGIRILETGFTSGDAIQIAAGMSVCIDPVNEIKMYYDSAQDRIIFSKAGDSVGYINMAGSNHAL